MNARIRELLAREGVPYEIIPHREVYTAQERAAACHISGRVLAKVVVLRDEDADWFALAVLPAAARLDLARLRRATGRPGLALATEDHLARLFPDCDVGATPPFGRPYGLEVYLDAGLADAAEMVFPGGTHREDVRIAMRDYLRVERPIVSLAVIQQAA